MLSRASSSLDPRVRHPDPRLGTGYANRQSDEVESLVPVGSTPTSVTLRAMGRWSKGKTPGLHPGNRGSIPRRSTEAKGVYWKVAGYGSPGRIAKPVRPARGYGGSNPMPSAACPSTFGRGLG